MLKRLRQCVGAALSLFPGATVLSAVPPILDHIVATTTESTGNLGPALSHGAHHLHDLLAFFGTDGSEAQFWLQVLMPSLTALLG